MEASQYKDNEYQLASSEEDNSSDSNRDEPMSTSIASDKIVKKPETGMEFETLDELISYYKSYARQEGFGISKRTSTKKGAGTSRYQTIVCNKAGMPRSRGKNILNPRPISKTNCRARINAVAFTSGGWKINSVELNHNHNLSPSNARFYTCHGGMDTPAKRTLELNNDPGTLLNASYNTLLVEASGHENVPFLDKDKRNYIQKRRQLQLQEGDAEAMRKYFVRMQLSNPSFFYVMDFDDKGRLKNVFWADARSRAAYEEFGDVVTLDTTYLADKHDMPFAPFVGVNHHGQSILFGCALICSEDTETFIWLFESWLTCMKGRAPNAIITNEDKAMQKAVEYVFPNARHRRCLWHIMKKIPEKLSGNTEYQAINFAFTSAVYDTLTPLEFEEKWGDMINKFNLDQNEWLHALYDIRYHWVPSYVKDRFWAGMSTTQKNESQNAFFDGYVNSKTTLKQFVDQYENALHTYMEKERKADFVSNNSPLPCISHFGIEKQVQMTYTTSKFQEFQEELKCGKLYCELSLLNEEGTCVQYQVCEDTVYEERRKEVLFNVILDKETNDVKCDCHLFEFRGILCRHVIVVLLHNKIDYVPSRYILDRWRKDLKRSHTKVKISYVDRDKSTDMIWFDKMHESFSVVANLVGDSQGKFNKVMDGIQRIKMDIQSCDEIDLEDNSVGKNTRKLEDCIGQDDISHNSKEKSKEQSPVLEVIHVTDDSNPM